jgi:flagellar basal-body rod modification protein FlgD
MSISSLSSATDSSVQTLNQNKGKQSLTQEDFLNLFITQIRFQNPLEPMDNHQMATQLAQFNSVEALHNMTEILENMLAYQTSMNNLQVAGLIGKKIEAAGNLLSIVEGKVSEGSYQLSQSGKVTVQIYDANGSLVRTIEEGTKDTSKQTLVWDGKNQQGVSQPDGMYTFLVSAVDEKGQSVSVDTHFIDTVDGISFENGVIYLNCGSKKITISNIIGILG